MNDFIKSVFASVLTVVFFGQSVGQGVSISESPSTYDNTVQVYSIDKYKVNITGTFFDIKNSPAYFNRYTSIDFDAESRLVAVIKSGTNPNAEIFNFDGKKIQSLDVVNVSPDDPSSKIYVLPNAATIIRNDIAFFDFYDADGKLKFKISNNTTADKGEAISGLVKDRFGKTILVYNPKIFNSNNPGSRVSRIDADGSKVQIFEDKNRFIKNITLSKGGQMVAIITSRQGMNDMVVLMDQFGNFFNNIESKENLIKVAISADQSYLTLISEGRMEVYRINSGERIGSSSVRGVPLMHANYFPDDNILVGIAGNLNEQTQLISDFELKIVDFNQRKIESATYNSPLSSTPLIKLELVRKGPKEYQLKGLNKTLNITARF